MNNITAVKWIPIYKKYNYILNGYLSTLEILTCICNCIFLLGLLWQVPGYLFLPQQCITGHLHWHIQKQEHSDQFEEHLWSSVNWPRSSIIKKKKLDFSLSFLLAGSSLCLPCKLTRLHQPKASPALSQQKAVQQNGSSAYK